MNRELPATPDTKSDRRLLLAKIGIIAAILIAYSPLFQADFSGADVQQNVTKNIWLNPPSWAGVMHYWRQPQFDLYVPLTYTFWSLVAKLGYVANADQAGTHLNPYIFHAANILTHIGAAMLVLSILRKLRLSLPAAFVGTMLFALHPLQVETVGWIPGFKDLLSILFSLSAILLWLSSSLALATICVIAGMLCKPIAMVIPAIVITIDLIVLKKPPGQTMQRSALWIVLSIACAVLAKVIQPAKFTAIIVPIWQRPFIAGDALTFYLFKLVWPIRLCVDYGRSPHETLATDMPYFTTFATLVIVVALMMLRRVMSPIALAGAAIFFIALSPMLGFTTFDYQFYSTVADHYLYLPMLGVAMVSGACIERFSRRIDVACIILLAFGIRTFLQTQTWTDSMTLFNHAIQINPKSWSAHESLAGVWLDANRPADAEREARIAVSIKPEDASAWGQLGNALTTLSQRDQAMDAYQRAFDLNPRDPIGVSNLAGVMAENGQLGRAIELYKTALELNPDQDAARIGLGRATAELRAKPTTQ